LGGQALRSGWLGRANGAEHLSSVVAIALTFGFVTSGFVRHWFRNKPCPPSADAVATHSQKTVIRNC